MEQADHGKIYVRKRSGVVASDESPTSTTVVEEQLQLADGDAVLKCFSPLLDSMKVFGLYFTQASCRIHDVSTSTSGTKDSQVPRKWNGGLIYATFVLVVVWLNAARMLSIFHKTDKFGVVVLLKLTGISAGFLPAFQQTACFIACQSRNLDRVFSDSTLPKSDVARYHRLAIIHTLVCWVSLLVNVSLFLPPVFMTMDHSMNWSMTPFSIHVSMTDHLLILAKCMTTLCFIFLYCAFIFSHSVNYMVTSVLYDQYCALNKDFSHAISCRGEFRGSIREFRRRHQQLSHSVQNADQFMMINNVAGFFCQILSLILILYCSIFFRNETVGHDVISAVMYVYWLVTTLLSLTLTACQGIVINHAVRVK